MSDLKEKLAAQERDFAPVADMLKRKFEIDAAHAPEVDIAAIVAGTLPKRVPRWRGKLFVRLAFAAVLLLLTVAILVSIYWLPSHTEAVHRLAFDDAERLLNANRLKEVTILYQSGRAEIQTDTPLPMVWVRKGEN